MKQNKEKSFEENLNKLEDIVNNLEGGELKLDESLSMFEQGINLAKSCQKTLDEAERKVQILIEKEDGEIEEKDF